MTEVYLFLLGLAVAALGSLMGVGGGFILVPVLLAMFPNYSHEKITALSLFSVAFNATSGSVIYWRKKKIHFQIALAFAAGSLPGAWIGVYVQNFIDRETFELVFGIALILLALFLIKPQKKTSDSPDKNPLEKFPLKTVLFGALFSLGISVCTNFLGLGGGIIHVPMLHHVMGLPVHFATGTSHFILALTAWTGTIAHWVNGDIAIFDPAAIALAIGSVIGAQIGAKASTRISGKSILRLLAVILFILGVRLILKKIVMGE